MTLAQIGALVAAENALWGGKDSGPSTPERGSLADLFDLARLAGGG